MEARILLEESVIEINCLRRQNEVMRAKLEMFDSMMLLFTTEPYRKGQGMSPDLVAGIERFLKENEHNPEVLK